MPSHQHKRKHRVTILSVCDSVNEHSTQYCIGVFLEARVHRVMDKRIRDVVEDIGEDDEDGFLPPVGNDQHG
jgi:hypothetical protein